MTEDERTGRRITIGIAWLAGVPPVLLLVGLIAAGYPVLKTTVISEGVVPIVLSWLLMRGRRWVRTLVVIGFGVNAAAAFVQLFRLEWTLTTMLLSSTDAVVHGLAAVVLLLSPQVRAFFEYQNRLVALGLSDA
ncbi:MAG TPA: hypothetical protein VFO31_29320 [Vicinamibacterales bacterium]|nr:hypothetical protein [Vicinamibacterales bacterium]